MEKESYTKADNVASCWESGGMTFFGRGKGGYRRLWRNCATTLTLLLCFPGGYHCVCCCWYHNLWRYLFFSIIIKAAVKIHQVLSFTSFSPFHLFLTPLTLYHGESCGIKRRRWLWRYLLQAWNQERCQGFSKKRCQLCCWSFPYIPMDSPI